MKVLLIEDDPRKAERIVDYLLTLIPGISPEIARSYQSGLSSVLNNSYDFILLDMSLPIYDITPGESGFDAPSFAGEEILEEMDRKGIEGYVVVITQFETFDEGEGVTTLSQVTERLAQRFPDLFKGTIFYSPAESTWKSELAEFLFRK